MRQKIVYFTLLYLFLVALSHPQYAGAAGPGQTIHTALGDIVADPSSLTDWVVKNAIKVGGGSAFLLMLYGGFLFLTSAGDPQKLQEATDVIFSAIAGLLVIIFSVFLLEFIGYRILLIF